MKKAALYIRVSTLEQVDGYSISQQIDKLKKYCEINDWVIYEQYVDDGYSGTNVERPELTRLITGASLKHFDVVLIYKLDRLSRSIKDTMYLIEDVFLKNNVDIVSLQENFDTSTSFGKAMIGMLSVFAQFEVDQIKERMMLGKLGRAKSGKVNVGRFELFGYRYNLDTSQLEINDLEANIIKQIYNDYLNGISITKLREKLNKEGHIGKDKNWSYRTVRQALDNPHYAGYVTFNKEVFEGTHEPIISKEQYEAVQMQLKLRQEESYKKGNPRPFQTKYLLSGLLKCGYCGCPLKFIRNKPRQDGTRNNSYVCYNRSIRTTPGATIYNNNIKCDSPIYKVRELEEKVINEVSKIQQDPKKIDKIINSKNKPTSNDIDVEGLKKRLIQLDNKIKKETDLYRNDFINMEELNISTENIKLEKKGILAKLEQSKINNDKSNSINLKLEFLKMKDIRKMDYEKQKVVIKMIIKRIEVTEDDLKIHWFF